MSTNIATIRREALWVLIALLAGLLVLPPLIWLVGSRVFGPYAAGGTRDLVDHFYRSLGHGEQAVWLVALGPLLGLAILRLTLAGMRAVRRQA